MVFFVDRLNIFLKVQCVELFKYTRSSACSKVRVCGFLIELYEMYEMKIKTNLVIVGRRLKSKKCTDDSEFNANETVDLPNKNCNVVDIIMKC